MTPSLHVYLFGYNRVESLQNAIASVERYASDFAFTIIDDNSPAQAMTDYLDSIKGKHRVEIRQPSIGEYKTGGLYSNMRYALESAKKHGASYVLFLQDDMQLTRKISSQDIDAIEQFFAANEACFQLQTCFLKKFFLARDRQRLKLDDSKKAYFRELADSAYSGFSGFSAVGVFHIERFFELFGEFQQGEYNNNQRAIAKDIKMGLARYPFMMWLPFPQTNRGKGKPLTLKVLESISNAGFYPYAPMRQQLVEQLWSAEPEVLPIAEDYLEVNAKLPEVWSFAGGVSNLRPYYGWRGLLAKFIDKVKN